MDLSIEHADAIIPMSALHGTPELTTEARQLSEQEVRELEELILDGELAGEIEFGLESMHSNRIPLSQTASNFISIALSHRNISLEDETTSSASENKTEAQDQRIENKLSDKLKNVKGELLKIWEKIRKVFEVAMTRVQGWFKLLFNKGLRAKAAVESLIGKLNALNDEAQPLGRTFESAGVATLGLDGRPINEETLKEHLVKYSSLTTEFISGGVGSTLQAISTTIDDGVKGISSALQGTEVNSPEELMQIPKIKSTNESFMTLLTKLQNGLKSKLKAKQVTDTKSDSGFETDQLLGGKRYSVVLPQLSGDKEALLNFWELSENIKGEVSQFKDGDRQETLGTPDWETGTKDGMLEVCEVLKPMLELILSKQQALTTGLKAGKDLINALDRLVKSDRVSHPEVKKYIRRISSGSLKLHKNILSISSVWLGYCIETTNAAIAFMVKSLEQY